MAIENFEDYKKYSQLGAELYNKKDYPRALKVFQELAKVNYDNFKVHETLAYIHLRMNQVEEADREFRVAMDIARRENGNFEKPKTFEELATEVGDQKTLETEYTTLLKKSDEEVLGGSRTAIHLGILYMAQGQYKKAEEILSQYKNRCLTALG